MIDFNQLVNSPEEFIQENAPRTNTSQPIWDRLAKASGGHLPDSGTMAPILAQVNQRAAQPTQPQPEADDNSPGGILRSAMEEYRNSGDSEWDAAHWGQAAIRRLPFIGAVQSTVDAVSVRNAALRIRDGQPERGRGFGDSQGDYALVARYLVEQERAGQRSIPADILNIISHLPGFAVEFMATSGAFSAGRAGATSLATRLLGQTAGTTAGRVAVGTAGYVAGAGAQAALMPHRTAETAARRAIPQIGPDGQITDPGNPISQLPAGFLDTWIEVGTERAGDAIAPLLGRTRLGRILNYTGNQGSGVGGALRALGNHGPAAELFEERLGDTLRGMAGLTLREDGSRDYGVIQGFFDGRQAQSGQQLLAETLAFAAIPVAHAAANRAMRTRGMAQPAVDQRLGEVANAMTLAYQEGQTRAEAQATLNDLVPAGPARDIYGESFLPAFPETRAIENRVTQPTQAQDQSGVGQAELLPGYELREVPVQNAPESLPTAQASTGGQISTEPAPSANLGQPEPISAPSAEPVRARPSNQPLQGEVSPEETAAWNKKASESRAHFGERTIAQDWQDRLEAAKLAPVDRKLIESALSLASYRVMESSGEFVHPKSNKAYSGKPMSDNTIKLKAEQAFKKLKANNPVGLERFDSLEDVKADFYVQEAEEAVAYAQKMMEQGEVFSQAEGSNVGEKGGRQATGGQSEGVKFSVLDTLLEGEESVYQKEIDDAKREFFRAGYDAGKSHKQIRAEYEAASRQRVKNEAAQEGAGTSEGDAVSYFKAGQKTATGQVAPAMGGKVISPFEWIKTGYTWFRAPFSVGKVHGNQDAAYLEAVGKAQLGSMYAGDVHRAAHELGHHVASDNGFPVDPAELAKVAGVDVVKGFQQFDYDPKRILGAQTIREGFAEWFRQRITGEETQWTPEQMAAAAFAEKWIRDKGFTNIIDRLRGLSENYRGASEELRARLEISPKGAQADPTGLTATEAVRTNAETLAFQAQQNLDDNLKILTDVQKASGKTPEKGRDLRTVWSAIRVMARSWADSFAGKGMMSAEIDAQGNWTFKRIGEGVDWVIRDLGFTQEDLKPEGTGPLRGLLRWMGLPVKQAASKLDTFMIALASVREVERGLQMKASGNTLLNILDGKQIDAEATKNLMAYLEKFGDSADAQWYKSPDLLAQMLDIPAKAVSYRGVATQILTEGEKLVNTVAPRQAKIFREYLNKLKADNPAWYARGEEALNRIAILNDNILTGLESVGWYSEEDTKKLRAKYPNYIPMYRVVEGEEFVPNRDMKRFGSGRQLVSPITALESRYAEAQYIFAKQLKDNALLEAVAQQAGPMGIGGYLTEVNDTPEVRRTDIRDTLNAMGIDEKLHDQIVDVLGVEIIHALQPKAWSDSSPNLYEIRSRGKKYSFQIDSKPLYNLLTDMQMEASTTAETLSKIAAIPGLNLLKRLQTWGATQANLVFPVRNPIRDVWHLPHNEGATLETLAAWWSGQKHSLKTAAAHLFGKEMPAFDTLYADTTGQALREFGYTTKSEGAKAFRAIRGESGAEKPIWALHKVQEFLELVGFAEQGPRQGAFYRALAEMGYTRAQVEQAMQADARKSPIPLHVLFYATQRAAESTVDFNRQGVWTKEFGKISPFFSPHMAGMSQEIRNWEKARQEGFVGPKSKAMLGTLALYLGFELLHYFIFKDDEWYNNLPDHLRYDWWVLGQTKDGGTFGVPKPQGLMRMAGAFFQESLRSSSGNDPRMGMAASAVGARATPRVLPVGVNESVELLRNRDWRNRPIVPRRDENSMSSWEQFRTYQFFHVLEQLTGGLASARALRLPTEAFTSSRSEPNLPVTEFYEELRVLEGQRTQHARRGQPFPAEARYDLLHRIEQRMTILSREARGERMVNGRVVQGSPPSAERLRFIRQEQIRLAQLARQR